MTFVLETYLNRLALTDVPTGAEGLAALQAAHMRAIPFENIDPLLGTVPSLSPEALAEKLIARRRGGYCFEHNALFGHALAALGYATRPVLARVRNGASRGGARTHQAFLVEADDELWLCDTGFGGHGPLHPLRLTDPHPQTAPNGPYRVRPDTDFGETVIERHTGDGWMSLFGFDDAPARAVDFEAANFLCARWEGVPFSANLLVAFHAEARRIALFNRALTLGASPDAEHRLLASASDLARVLTEDCGLDIASDTIARIWAKIEHAPTSR
jgi:N-hydroxyarylamine O-acetyltransferase